MAIDSNDQRQFNGILGAAGIMASVFFGLTVSKFFFALCVVMVIVALVPKSD